MVHCNPLPLLSTLLILLSLSGPLYCGATEYYVKPTEGTPCPEPCHTLTEYAQNASQYFTSAVNVTILFLPGVHHLNQTLSITNASNMSFRVDPTATAYETNVTILCNNGSGLEFVDTSNLTIEHLIFSYCGIPCPPYPDPCLGDLSSCTYSFEDKGVGSINLNNITNLRIMGVTIEKGWPILTQNVLGYSEIADLTARHTNIWGLAVSFNDTLLSTINTSLSNHLVVRDSQFYSKTDSGAICARTDTLTVEIDIVRISINRDTTELPIPAIQLLLASSSVIAIMDCHLANGVVGISVSVLQGTSVSPQISSNIPMEGHVLISRCEIKGYTGIPLQFGTYGRNNIFQVTIVDSVFANNSCSTEPGSCSVLWTTTPVTLINTTFEDNIYIDPIGLATTVYLDGVNNASFINCTFHRNIGTPISAINSSYIVSGNMRFVNNTGQKGGAMAFYHQSQVIIDSDIHTHILFQNNSAVVGGAILVDNVVDVYYLIYSPPRCFLAFTCSDMITSVSLDFINNTATDGGNGIYGAMLDICLYNQGRGAATVISRISHFEPSEDLSKITSPPSRVCLCDRNRKPDCASSIQSVYPRPKYHYPGETFTISAALVGDEFGTVSGSVYAQFLLLNKSRTAPQFGALQQSQSVGHDSCTNLKYTVLSENGSEIIVLTASGATVDNFVDEEFVDVLILDFNDGFVDASLLLLPVYLNITLLSCPLGFTLASPPGECVCNKRIKNNNITCNITDQSLHRSGTTWINASSDGVIIATNCPFHYCKPGEVAVNLSSPDSQCEFNHSGTLCGGCQPGFSLTLGSSQCLPCSNKYLALLIAFIAAGVALVFFIKILNLTVSKGTINGLIFYANIVGAIPTTFFPAGDTNLLTVFIAWLNLDLGIQTCFFDGLDVYWKTWLQFVFPAYILAIIGLIILLSRLSEWVTKIFGSNSADILATLLLLSYAKLFRTIIAVFSFSFLELPDGTRTAVWSLDGNIPYLSGKHIPLFLAALAVLLLLWLPFTAVLLFWQLLQRLTHYRIVRWIVITKRPFFNTYFGPLKGEHRYWVGILLLVRGILLIIFAVVPTDSIGVHLLSVNTVAIVLLTYVANLPQSQQQGEDRRALAAQQNLSLSQKVHDYFGILSGCYNSWYLSLLENSCILNLGVLSAANFYVYFSDGNQAAVVYTSVGIAFAQFVGIICLHVFLSLRKWWKNRRERVDGELQDPNRAEYERINDEPAPVRDGPLLRVDFSQYREPVLELFD